MAAFFQRGALINVFALSSEGHIDRQLIKSHFIITLVVGEKPVNSKVALRLCGRVSTNQPRAVSVIRPI